MEDLSLGQSVRVLGYEIRKMPLGAYLKALRTVEALPSRLLDACFPGLDAGGVMRELLKLDSAMLRRVCADAAANIPEYLIGVVAELSGVPRERLKEDENIGLDGLLRIVNAVIEVNRLEDVFGQALALKKTVSAMTAGSRA